jgi:hypothetical protein
MPTSLGYISSFVLCVCLPNEHVCLGSSSANFSWLVEAVFPVVPWYRQAWHGNSAMISHFFFSWWLISEVRSITIPEVGE